MNGVQSKNIGARAALIAVALANLLTIASAGCDENPERDAAPGGRGALVSPYAEVSSCAKTVYRGPETALYANRSYHTAERVNAAVGLAFCRGMRHGTKVWIVEISKPTTLVAFGSEAFGLEQRGWAAIEEALFVAASGLPLDRIYTKHFDPGRYVIRQGFAPTALLVFWDEAAVRLAR
jgi:hypothetical protein